MIATEIRKAGPYACNGVTTSFPFSFKVFEAGDVQVVLQGAEGVEIVLTLNSAYSVVLNPDQDDDPGGSVITTAAYPVGSKITILSDVDELQPAVVTNGGGFYPRVFNDAFDRAVILIQQLSEKIGRAIIAPASDGGGSLVLPGVAQRKNKYLGFDNSGLPIATDARGPKGDPGGNAMAIGLFTDASALNIPIGTDLVITSGHHKVGVGSGRYAYSATDPGLPASAQFLSANGRWFRLIPEGGEVAIEQTGGEADAVVSGFFTATAGTFNDQPLLDALAVAGSFTISAFYVMGPTVVCGPGKYRFAGPIEPRRQGAIRGVGNGQDDFNGGTNFYFPADCHGIVINRTNTTSSGYNGGAPLGAADGFIVDGITCVSAGGTDAGKHGFWMRARAEFRRCMAYGFPGNGFNIVASAGAGTAGGGLIEGNANGWRLSDCLVKDCKGYGVYVFQNDANAGIATKVEVRSCGKGAFWDRDTLGNTYEGIRVDDWDSLKVGGAGYDGRLWVWRGGVGVTAGLPGTDANWLPVAAGAPGGFYPAYSAGKLYSPAIPFYVTGLSNRTTLNGLYTEGGFSDVSGSPAIVIPGQATFTQDSGALIKTTGDQPPAVFSFSGVGGLHRWADVAMTARYGTFSAAAIGVNVGGDYCDLLLDNERVGRRSLAFNSTNNNYEFRVNTPSSGGALIFSLTTTLTTNTFGRAAVQPNVFVATAFVLGSVSSTNYARRFETWEGAPSGAGRAKGERTFNVNAPIRGEAGHYAMGDGTVQPVGIVGAVAAAAQANSSASTVAGVVADLNALLAKLRAANLMNP